MLYTQLGADLRYVLDKQVEIVFTVPVDGFLDEVASAKQLLAVVAGLADRFVDVSIGSLAFLVAVG